MSEPAAPPQAAPGLTHQSVRAGTSLAFIVASVHLCIFVRTLILARFLEPREFGLMGLAFIVISAADVLSQTGFNQAIVQRREEVHSYLPTFWTVSVVRGLILAVLVVAIAPALGTFFRTPDAVPVLRVLSIRFMLMGLANPAWNLLERDLKMVRYGLPSLIGNFVDLVVTAVLAWRLHSVWAMVIGFLIGAGVLTVMTYVVAPHIPRFGFDLARARKLRSFGKHVFRYEFLSYLVQQTDRIAVGRLRDTASLGLYTFASRLATMPAMLVQMVVARVAFPAFARIQEEPERVRNAYIRLMGLISIVSFPIAVGLVATAPEMIPVVFGVRWVPMTLPFQILCLMGVTTAIEQTCGTVAGGIGRPELAVRASLIRITFIALALVPATIYAGIEGTAAVTVLAACLSTLYLLRVVGRFVGAEAGGYLPVFGIPVAASGAMFVAVMAVRAWAPFVAAPAMLALMALAGATTYLVSTLVADRVSGSAMTTSIVGIFRSR